MRLFPGSRQTNLAFVLLLVGSLPLTGTPAIAADVSAEIGSRFESNASNSNRPSDRLADGFLTARVDAGTTGVWDRDWRWHSRISGEGEEAFRFNGLSQIEGGVRLGVDRKFGLGWKAPRLQFDVIRRFVERGSRAPQGSGSFRLLPLSGKSRKEGEQAFATHLSGFSHKAPCSTRQPTRRGFPAGSTFFPGPVCLQITFSGTAMSSRMQRLPGPTLRRSRRSGN